MVIKVIDAIKMRLEKDPVFVAADADEIEQELRGWEKGIEGDKETVIKNYEEMLEEASVKFPCNCGNNMFDGIFKPMEETVVECDYCKSKYAITLKLDTVLITEPLEDLNIDNLIRKNTEQ
jgi:redox-regulated HSP33 family molecular chaperone